LQALPYDLRITNIAPDILGSRIQVSRFGPMGEGVEKIEDPDFTPQADQAINQVGADEAGPPDDEDCTIIRSAARSHPSVATTV
jgi:hypothetical protein